MPLFAERDPSIVPPPSRGAGVSKKIRAARWARPLLAAVAGLAVAAGVVAAVAPWLYSPAALLAAVSSQLQDSTGLYVATRGQPRFSLAPRPHVSFHGVAFADRNGALVIEADELHGVLKILPLLLGRLDVDSLALVRPRARLDLDAKRIDAPGAAARAAVAPPATVEAQKADNVRLGVVNIVDGALSVRRNGVDYSAGKISAALDWRRVGEPALLKAEFDWKGERIKSLLWIARPGALLRGDPSVATGRLDAESFRLEAQGLAEAGANAHFSGRVAGTAASVRQALGLFNLSAPLPGPFGDARFSAQATISAREARLKEFQLVVDGNAFRGELALRDGDGRPNLAAELSSDFVALKPMFADAPSLVGADGQWSREPLDPPDLSGADVELRLAARHARLGRLTIDDATFEMALRDGILDLSLVDARAYRGRVKARASFRPAAQGLAVHAASQTSGVDANALLWDAFGKLAIGGALDSALSLDATGASMAELMRSLNGRASMTLSEGEIAGVDFERALRRLEKRPLASAQDIRSGSSTLDKASATLLVEQGIGTLEDGAAHGPGFALTFSGTANLAERTLSLKAVAREADNAGKSREKGLHISFDVAGGFDELTLAPDPQAFIRRSGAAAPLLPEAPPEPTAESER